MKTIRRELNGKTYNVEAGLIKGIRNADDGNGFRSQTYIQVFLDKETKVIWGEFHCSLGRNSWTEYDHKNIVSLGKFSDKDFLLSDLAQAITEEEELTAFHDDEIVSFTVSRGK